MNERPRTPALPSNHGSNYPHLKTSRNQMDKRIVILFHTLIGSLIPFFLS